MKRLRAIRGLVAAAGVVAVLVTGPTACGGSDPELPPPASPRPAPATTSPPAPLDPRDQEAWVEVQLLFDELMEVWIKWATEGSPEVTGGLEPALLEVQEYASSDFEVDVRVDLTELRLHRQLRTGRPVWRDAQLLGVDWENEVQALVVPVLTFEVCVDDSEWLVVDRETDEPVPGESGAPHVWTVTAAWIEERDLGPAGWALSEREAQRDRSC